MTAKLYAALGGANATSDLYTVDPGTGAVTSVGPIGYGLTGLAWDQVGGVMYGSTNLNTPDYGWLVSIDLATGAGTGIGEFPIANPAGGGHFTFSDLACDAAGNLYGWDSGFPGSLWSIDKATGGATLIGNSGLTGSTPGDGMDFSPSDGKLYAFPKQDNGHVYTVSLSTGAVTVGAALNGSAARPINAAAFAADGTCYAIRNTSPSQLITIDVATGDVVLVGGMGSSNFDALAWTVTTTPPPVADFSATPREGPASLTVGFTDLSSNSPTSWAWDFGDGGTSTAQNPTHIYTVPGVYDVTLTASN